MARACGVEGVRVDRAGDLGEAIRKGIARQQALSDRRPISPRYHPVGAGIWELPGLGQSKAGIVPAISPA